MNPGDVRTHVDDEENVEIQAEADYLQSLCDAWNDRDGGSSPTGSQSSFVGWDNPSPLTVPPARLLALAQWAFGHLPSLKIVAYGDYSHSGRFADYTKTLCKNELTTWEADDESFYNTISLPSNLTFRPVTKDDVDLQILLNASQGMLSACPVSRYL